MPDKTTIRREVLKDIESLTGRAEGEAVDSNYGVVLALTALTKAVMMIAAELRNLYFYFRKRDEIMLGGSFKIDDPE